MDIALIGFMGSGKTSIGKEVAKELAYEFYDTDELIEDKYGSISNIFNQYGEERFREIETEILKQVLTYSNIVLATGGGVVVKPENMLYIKQKLKIIWLKSSFDDIIKRLKDDGKRPLWSKNYSEMLEFFKYREGLYKKYADVTINNTDFNKTISAVRQYVYNTFKTQ